MAIMGTDGIPDIAITPIMDIVAAITMEIAITADIECISIPVSIVR